MVNASHIMRQQVMEGSDYMIERGEGEACG